MVGAPTIEGTPGRRRRVREAGGLPHDVDTALCEAALNRPTAASPDSEVHPRRGLRWSTAPRDAGSVELVQERADRAGDDVRLLDVGIVARAVDEQQLPTQL